MLLRKEEVVIQDFDEKKPVEEDIDTSRKGLETIVTQAQVWDKLFSRSP